MVLSKSDIEKINDFWKKEKVYFTDVNSGKKKFYMLDMFPYPSGDGLHVGHVKGYVGTDIYSRYMRMKGYEVLHPMGWDAFGLPAENYAIKTGINPKISTQKNIENFKDQFELIGQSFDWTKEINTTDPKYYKWTQWIFLQLFNKGLAYEDLTNINWCPKDKTGLANEEVVNGKCERCGTEVEQRELKQWILKITDYADRLLEDLDQLDWPESIKLMQKNWIGRSDGYEIVFDIVNEDLDIKVYTTRLDTIFGVKAIVIAPDHQFSRKIIENNYDINITKYIKKLQKQKKDYLAEKDGIFTNYYCENPLNQEKIPVYVSNYVVSGYGTGAVMVVPAHDERDFDFAEKFGLDITEVVAGGDKIPYTGYGVLVNSGKYTNQHSKEAIESIVDDYKKTNRISKKTNYKLRDWIFSRQRYWGEPIPLVRCKSCGIVGIPESELPLLLPETDDFLPSDDGLSPLTKLDDWKKTTCPKCGGEAERETHTMPQWAGSCWYYLRYLDPDFDQGPFQKGLADKWIPVDFYVGGAEHAVLHLLYARFWHKFFYDLGILSSKEPFRKLRNVGMVLGQDGVKMSKSKGNVINPNDYVKAYGPDTLRVYEMFMGPFESVGIWNPESVEGVNRFIKKVKRFFDERIDWDNETDNETLSRIAILSGVVEKGIETMSFNTVVSAFMEFFNYLSEHQVRVTKEDGENLLKLMAPYMPFLTEKVWLDLGNKTSIHLSTWPVYADSLKKMKYIEIPVQVNGKRRFAITAEPGSDQSEIEKIVSKCEEYQKYELQSASKIIFVKDRIINYII